MLQALQIMLMAVAITAVTGFLISLLIHGLSALVRLRSPETQNEEEITALAVALAVRRNGQKIG